MACFLRLKTITQLWPHSNGYDCIVHIKEAIGEKPALVVKIIVTIIFTLEENVTKGDKNVGVGQKILF
jgi:hypothetical protein